MIITNIENILKDENKFNFLKEQINYAYDLLSLTKPVWLSKKPIEIYNNDLFSRQIENYFKSNKSGSSEYKKIIETASEKEFKQTFKVDYKDYYNILNKVQKKAQQNDDDFNIVTELTIMNYIKNPDMISKTKLYLREAINDLEDKSKYSEFVRYDNMNSKIINGRDLKTNKDHSNKIK